MEEKREELCAGGVTFPEQLVPFGHGGLRGSPSSISMFSGKYKERKTLALGSGLQNTANEERVWVLGKGKANF